MSEKHLHIEATAGISGDMLLGAFLDVGVPVEILYEAWSSLEIDNYEVEIFHTQKCGMKALQCQVRTQEEHGPKRWKEYRELLRNSRLSKDIRDTAVGLIRKLFMLESQIHGVTLDRLHLHEMGGTDLLIDVVGTLAAVQYLKPGKVTASPVNTGKGFVHFSHGSYPVPTPITTNILVGTPVFQNDMEGELTTPTGALLLTHLAEGFSSTPEMVLQAVGTGAGERDYTDHPNVVRIFLGEGVSTSNGEDVFIIETNIDDASPQVLAYFQEKAFALGALDVFFTPIFMKKNRPAVRLSILTTKALQDSLIRLLFHETTAIGLRFWKVDRKTLERKWKSVQLGKHKIRIKESYLDGQLYNFQPEFEDCKKVAQSTKRPLKDVIAHAIHTYLK